VFTLDDVDAAFACVQPLKFSQGVHLAASGITVTPYAAGHLLGGTIWKISKDTEDVLYAVDFNHKKERHLNGTVLEQVSVPGAERCTLPCGSRAIFCRPVPNPNQLDSHLVPAVGGSIG
jgi:hypothetical protein